MTIPLWTKPEFRLAVIGIEYPDIKHNAKVSVADWEEALLGEGTYHAKKNAADQDVHGSLNDYFVEQSAGAFRLKGKVFDWIEVGKKRADYILGSGTTNITAVLTEALEKVVTRDGKDAFKDFDGFLFLYAGEADPREPGGRLLSPRGDDPELPDEALAVRARARRGASPDDARRHGQGVRPDARPARPRGPDREPRAQRVWAPGARCPTRPEGPGPSISAPGRRRSSAGSSRP